MDVLERNRHTTCLCMHCPWNYPSMKSTTTAHRSLRIESIRRQASPIRTVCAWCAAQNRPAAVLVDVPLDARGVSHGICPSCRSMLKADSFAAFANVAVGAHV